MYINNLLDKIDRINRKGSREFNVFPIEAVNIFDNLIKDKYSKLLKKKKNQNDKYLFDNLYPNEYYPLFLTSDRLIFLIFHLNSVFYSDMNKKLEYNNTEDDRRYIKYILLYSDDMNKYNHIDVFLELLKTISRKLYFKKLLYFSLALFKCLDTVTYVACRYIDNIIYNEKHKDIIDELLKKEKNTFFKKLKKTIEISTNKSLDFETRYNNFYSKYFGSNIPASLNICILLCNFYFKDNPELKNEIDIYDDALRDTIKSDKYILDKYDDVLNILLFYYTKNIKKNKYEEQRETVLKIYENDNGLYLLKNFVDGYLYLNNNMIDNMINKSSHNNSVFFKDPFSAIYNHNFYYKNTLSSFIWNTTVLFNDRDLFNRIYSSVDSAYTPSLTPNKSLSKHYNTSNSIEMATLTNISRTILYDFDIYTHKYNRLIPYLYLNFINKYMRKKGVAFQISRLPYIKASITTSLSSNLKKTILSTWNIIPYRYNTVTTKISNNKKKIFNNPVNKVFENPVYGSMGFISTCCDIWSHTKMKRIQGSSSLKGKFKRPPSYCNEIHIFSYNGKHDINKDTFKKEKRRFPRILLNKIFVDIFKIKIMKEDLYGRTSMSLLNTTFYYDVSINLNIGDNTASMPIFFKNIKRVYKRKNRQDIKEACLCKHLNKYDYLKFFRIEDGIVYIYSKFYKLLLETFSLDQKKKQMILKIQTKIHPLLIIAQFIMKIKN